MTIIVCCGAFFLGPDNLVEAFIMAGLAGVGVATGILIPWSMLPDTIDLDHLRTGQQREGDLYAIFGLFQKIGLN